MMEAIRFKRAQGNYGAFSNFRENVIAIDGRCYRNTEAAFQAYKTTDVERRKDFEILAGASAKAEGKRIQLRPDWEEVKFKRMVDVNYVKFATDAYLKNLLLSTGTALIIEDTTGRHDNEWGCCNCPRCQNKPAHNKLGMALMVVRHILREEDDENNMPIDISFTEDNTIRVNLADGIDKYGIPKDQKMKEALEIAYRKAL